MQCHLLSLNWRHRKPSINANLERSHTFKTDERCWLFQMSQLIFTFIFIHLYFIFRTREANSRKAGRVHQGIKLECRMKTFCFSTYVISLKKIYGSSVFFKDCARKETYKKRNLNYLGFVIDYLCYYLVFSPNKIPPWSLFVLFGFIYMIKNQEMPPP